MGDRLARRIVQKEKGEADFSTSPRVRWLDLNQRPPGYEPSELPLLYTAEQLVPFTESFRQSTLIGNFLASAG